MLFSKPLCWQNSLIQGRAQTFWEAGARLNVKATVYALISVHFCLCYTTQVAELESNGVSLWAGCRDSTVCTVHTVDRMIRCICLSFTLCVRGLLILLIAAVIQTWAFESFCLSLCFFISSHLYIILSPFFFPYFCFLLHSCLISLLPSFHFSYIPFR